jgi:pantoate--beta-alanine ligase
MGALHAGHMSLVQEARKWGTEVLVSIFVNPAQFNNPDDLKKYPRTVISDLLSLKRAGATAVFIPASEDLYPAELEKVDLELGALANVYEGEFRPGHFDGVVKVLHRLFKIISPEHVFLGLKDLQQCLVVEKLIQTHFPEISQHNMPTLREANGLAMSSRNTRLSENGKQKAAAIYKVLHGMISGAIKADDTAKQQLLDAGIETEYLDLIELPDMKKVDQIHSGQRSAAIFAGYLEGVRLIDNLTAGE